MIAKPLYCRTLVLVLLLSMAVMFLHELEHTLHGEEAHGCQVCLIGAALGTAAVNTHHTIPHAAISIIERSIAIDYFHSVYIHSLSRAPPSFLSA